VAAGDEDRAVVQHLLSCPACTRYVTTLQEEAAAFRASHDATQFVARARRRRPRWSVWVAAPLLAAAAVLIFVQSRSPPTGTRFKGVTQVAVVRDRDGRQERLAGPLVVRAGDRIRIEISNDRPRPLTAGLVTDGGQWVPLLAPGVVPAGVSLSELAARFDASPTRATLLVGSPEAIERARRTRNFAGLLTAWPVTSEH
jgi:hypothetical protein